MRDRPAVVPFVTALGGLLLSFLAVSVTGGHGVPGIAEPAMAGPVSSLDSPAAVQGVEIHFDEVVPAGEIPPPEREYAAGLDSAGRAALRLQRACRFVHGTIAGDADFEVCLPTEGWNGKLVVWSPDLGFSLRTLARPENRVAERDRDLDGGGPT